MQMLSKFFDFKRLTDTAVWQSATCNYTMVIAFIDTVHRQNRIEHQEICIIK